MGERIIISEGMVNHIRRIFDEHCELSHGDVVFCTPHGTYAKRLTVGELFTENPSSVTVKHDIDGLMKLGDDINEYLYFIRCVNAYHYKNKGE